MLAISVFLKYTQKDSTPPAGALETQAIPHTRTSGGADSGAVDPLSAFVVSLTPEQRAALVRLLTTTPTTG